MSKNDTKAPILIKKNDAKNASLWHEFADKRFIKQHGGYDIPEGDNHAVPKYDSPVSMPQQTPEEMNTALSDLENEIKQLKDKDRTFPPANPPYKNDDKNNF